MPHDHSRPRLRRIEPESKQYAKTTYRKSIKHLLGETGGRCGYSLQHVRDFGDSVMDVDHINPILKHPLRNQHGNLIAASRHCNGRKSQVWPDEERQAKGMRFLNPYEECDYGLHILEDLDTGILVGTTPTGRWHIRMLGLNADFLVLKRRDRTRLATALKKAAYRSGSDPSNEMFETLNELMPVVKDAMLTTMIPFIAKASKSALGKK